MSLSFSRRALTALLRDTLACTWVSKHVGGGVGVGRAHLRHNKLNVLALKPGIVNLLAVLLLNLLGLGALNGLALLGGSGGEVSLDAVGALGLAELVGSVGLGLGVQVLDLGLAEDDPGVAGGRLVDLGVVDDKEDLSKGVSTGCPCCC